MRGLRTCFHTVFLALFSLALVGGAIAADYFFRHEPSRKAKRFLARQNIELTVDSAIELAGKGDLALLGQMELARMDLGNANDRGVTPLLSALRNDQNEVVDFLLSSESVVEHINQKTTPENDSPMAHVLREENLPMAEKLADMGAATQVEKYSGLPFLIDAVERKDDKMVDFLLAHKVDVNRRGTQPYSAAAVAADRDDLPMLKKLAGAGADLNVIGGTGNPLLIESVNQHNYDRLDFLLANGADVKVKALSSDVKGRTAVSFAVASQDGWMTKRLFQAGADPNTIGAEGGSLLYEAVDAGDAELANDLLNYGASANGTGASGETALARAVRGDDLDLVEILLKNGAKPDLGGEKSESPLLSAIGNGNVAISKMLIESGAELDWQEALSKAFEMRDDPLMNLLLNAGADPESTLVGTDQRIFDVAVREGATSAVRTLLDAGSEIGDNLWAALLTKQDDLVHIILDGGADPSRKGPNGKIPLAFALENQRYRVGRLLLDAGANPNVPYNDTESWLARAVRDNIPEIAGPLIKAGAHVKGVKARDGISLLSWAIANEMSSVAVDLIQAGVDVNERETSSVSSDFRNKFKSTTFQYHLRRDSGIRPLHVAAVKRDYVAAQAIMDAGGKGNVYTRKYLFPVNIGAWYGDTDMMQIVLLGKVPEVQPRKVVIDLSRQRATLYKEGKSVFSSRVSTGKSGHRTPAGNYVISDKHRYHTSTIYAGASMPYFMRLSCAAFGMHQSNSVPSYPASHGCIRMPYSGASHLFSECKVGDLVIIQP